MSLFQPSVLQKYLHTIDAQQLDAAWQRFTTHFDHPTIQANIRAAKEEQYQGEFLIDLFVQVLGYRKNPTPDFNLTTELKNVRGAKKTDGAILKDNKAIAVIELKGTNTTDLNKVEAQAFGYKNNQPNCVYVITSNFEKLRFYIHHAVDFEEFNLFTLTKARFKLLYLCLAADYLLQDMPLNIKQESLTQEESVTKQLYRDYSLFRKNIFTDIQQRNPQYDKLTLFKKTQKLLDRFLFIFFAEDRLLLPPNSIHAIAHQWVELRDKYDAYVPLYDRFKKYFGYLHTGHKGHQHDIFAYNGGLFKPDELLDNIKISDEVLHQHCLQLSNYDFESEISVNILGHIFEHSLNEMEDIQAELAGQPTDKRQSKRKKDGVFYTPKYITKYIVDHTVGQLCTAKKETLGIQDGDYDRNRKGRRKATLQKLKQQLADYRQWLLDLTICDPACGSGAFLNQALEFLIAEHEYIDELQAKLLGGGFVFPDVENVILEKNLFGVDINEESVEIAKLSLWLRTAQKGRKLTTLNNNIKCGNSLIDDPEVAGEKAFCWEKEFPQVFVKGGFDVVVGNPPYVRQELIAPFKPYLKKTYQTYQGTADLYTYFIEISVDRLLKPSGIYSIIVANKWMRASYGKPLRQWLTTKQLIEIIDFGDLPVFADATAYPCILTLSPQQPTATFWASEPTTLDFSDLDLLVNQLKFKVKISSLSNDGWALVEEKVSDLLDKLKNIGTPLKEYVNNKIYRGVLTGLNEAFVIDESTKKQLIAESPTSAELIKPFLAGRDVKRYALHFQNRFLIFTRRGTKIEEYPAIKKYLEQFREKLTPKPKDWKGSWKGRKAGSYKWFEIQDSIDYYQEFEQPKIIYPNICKQPEFAWDNTNFYTNQKCFIISHASKHLVGLLNSNIMRFYFKIVLPELRGGFFEPGFIYMKDFPIPAISKDVELAIEEKVNALISWKDAISNRINKFLKRLKTNFELPKTSRKIDTFYQYDFKILVQELKKKKIKLSLIQQDEWEEYFEAYTKDIQQLQANITQTDHAIDQLVYQLYGLSEAEIKIIEKNGY